MLVSWILQHRPPTLSNTLKMYKLLPGPSDQVAFQCHACVHIPKQPRILGKCEFSAFNSNQEVTQKQLGFQESIASQTYSANR